MNEDRLVEMLDMLKEDLQEIESSINNMKNAITVREAERERIIEAINELEGLLNGKIP